MIWKSDGEVRSTMAATKSISGDTANNIHKSPHNSSVAELLKVMSLLYISRS